MPPSLEILDRGRVLASGTVKQCRADLDAIERQIGEMEAPVKLLEVEISRIQEAIERGKGLSVSDPFEFASHGGEKLMNELQSTLSSKIARLDSLRIETHNLQQPLQITKSNLLAFLAEQQEKSQRRKERELLLREEKESPINLLRWAQRSKAKPNIWKVIAMAEKREKQVLGEICDLYNLKIVSRKELSEHYARKYKDFRLHLYKRGYYLIPHKNPKGRKIIEHQNHDQIATDECKNKTARTA